MRLVLRNNVIWHFIITIVYVQFKLIFSVTRCILIKYIFDYQPCPYIMTIYIYIYIYIYSVRSPYRRGTLIRIRNNYCVSVWNVIQQ